MVTFTQHKKIYLKRHPLLDEKWLQDRIADDPSIIGLGDLIVKDKERLQPGSGRLDLLLQDPDANLRYEVEIQLGKTDESHIIRTIEYWDIERKRYPQYDHVAVIVAEDITSRFFNIISLFNGFIPLIAIQLNAIDVDNRLALVFTTVLDQRNGAGDEEDEIQEPTDRLYWEKRGSKKTVAMADELLQLSKEIDRDLELKYNKFYIGLSKGSKPFNFVIFRPQKEFIRIEIKLNRTEEVKTKLDDSDLDLLEYSSRNRRYRIRLTSGDLTKHKNLLLELLHLSYKEYMGNDLD